MNDYYLYDYSNLLERVFSYAYKYRYSMDDLERSISYSSFFQEIEKDGGKQPPPISDIKLVSSIYPEASSGIDDLPIFNQCLWASESYLWIQEATKLTFEAIFLYLPISKMFFYFPVYHEMDFSQIVNEFKRLFGEKTILSILLDKYGYSLKQLSEMTNIPYETLKSYKNRKRDIKKADVSLLYKLASFFHVRIETIAEIEL